MARWKNVQGGDHIGGNRSLLCALLQNSHYFNFTSQKTCNTSYKYKYKYKYKSKNLYYKLQVQVQVQFTSGEEQAPDMRMLCSQTTITQLQIRLSHAVSLHLNVHNYSAHFSSAAYDIRTLAFKFGITHPVQHYFFLLVSPPIHRFIPQQPANIFGNFFGFQILMDNVHFNIALIDVFAFLSSDFSNRFLSKSNASPLFRAANEILEIRWVRIF